MFTIILFSFLAMLSWGLGDFLIQKNSRIIGEFETLFWIGLIGSIGLLPFVWNDLHLIQGPTWFLVLGLGLILFIASFIDIRALNRGKLSVIDVVLEIELPITVVLSIFFFGEVLSVFQIIMILCILLGIILIATKSFSHLEKGLEKGVLLAVVAALLMGLANFLTGVSAKSLTPMIAVWAPLVFITFACLFFLKKNTLLKNLIKHKKLIFGMAIIDTLAWSFYALAMEKGEISIVTAITESYPVIAMFLGVKFNKEKIVSHQWIGASLALLASVVLATTI